MEQINKDFNLANEGIDFPMSIAPEELKIQLHEKIYRLIQYKFAEYLNLLYIIDVPENEIRATRWFRYCRISRPSFFFDSETRMAKGVV